MSLVIAYAHPESLFGLEKDGFMEKLTAAYEERTGIEEPPVPENSYQSERPGHETWDLCECAVEAGIITATGRNIALDVIPFDEIESSGVVIRVFPKGHAKLGVTAGWCPLEDLVLSQEAMRKASPEEALIHMFEQIIERANETLVLASGEGLNWQGITEALEGDSNDAEHDALVEVADALGMEWTSPYDFGE